MAQEAIHFMTVRGHNIVTEVKIEPVILSG